jgi:hypothetical protein
VKARRKIMSDMKEGELGVLVQEEGDVYSLQQTIEGDEKLYDLIEEYLNKKACTMVKIRGAENHEE